VIIQIGKAKHSPKSQKKVTAHMDGKFNNGGSADLEIKYLCINL
jgi:hypothetical protein